MRSIAAIVMMATFILPVAVADDECKAPELVCKASQNQDRSLYVRDRSRYVQKLHVERYKLSGGQEKIEEIRDTTVSVEPAIAPDKTGQTPVVVRVTADTDKKGNPKSKVKEDERTLLSFGAVWDLAFFPLLPERVNNYNYEEVVSQREGERWFRFTPKAEVTNVPLAAGVAQLDAQTGEVLTIKIDSLHNLAALDKNASKLKAFNATIDYSQFQGALRLPTLASGVGVSEISRFNGNFRFRFEEGKYVLVSKVN